MTLHLGTSEWALIGTPKTATYGGLLDNQNRAVALYLT